MKNKKYKTESFNKYFYGLNPRVDNKNKLDDKLFLLVFDDLRNEYTVFRDIYEEIKLHFYDINKKRH